MEIKELNNFIEESFSNYAKLKTEVKNNLNFKDYLAICLDKISSDDADYEDDDEKEWEDLEEESEESWLCKNCEKDFDLEPDVEKEIERIGKKEVECPHCHEKTICEYEDEEKDEENKAREIANHLEFKKYLKNQSTRNLFIKKFFPDLCEGLYPWELNQLTNMAKAIYDTEINP